MSDDKKESGVATVAKAITEIAVVIHAATEIAAIVEEIETANKEAKAAIALTLATVKASVSKEADRQKLIDSLKK